MSGGRFEKACTKSRCKINMKTFGERVITASFTTYHEKITYLNNAQGCLYTKKLNGNQMMSKEYHRQLEDIMDNLPGNSLSTIIRDDNGQDMVRFE